MAQGYKTGGRKKGSANKLSAGVKDAIAKAFHKVGGADYLVKIAEDNPAVFCQLVGRLVPMEVTGELAHNYVMRAPAPSQTAEDWKDKHTPGSMVQ